MAFKHSMTAEPTHGIAIVVGGLTGQERAQALAG